MADDPVRIYELDPQAALIDTDVLVFDNPALTEARKITKVDLIADINNSLPPPVIPAGFWIPQDPPIDSLWSGFGLASAIAAPDSNWYPINMAGLNPPAKSKIFICHFSLGTNTTGNLAELFVRPAGTGDPDGIAVFAGAGEELAGTIMMPAVGNVIEWNLKGSPVGALGLTLTFHLLGAILDQN